MKCCSIESSPSNDDESHDESSETKGTGRKLRGRTYFTLVKKQSRLDVESARHRVTIKYGITYQRLCFAEFVLTRSRTKRQVSSSRQVIL